jgi:hypothetical protein
MMRKRITRGAASVALALPLVLGASGIASASDGWGHGWGGDWGGFSHSSWHSSGDWGHGWGGGWGGW